MSEEPLDTSSEPGPQDERPQGGNTLVGYNELPDENNDETARAWERLAGDPETPQEQMARIQESMKPQGGHTLVGNTELPSANTAETANEWASLEQAVNYEDLSAEERLARGRIAEYFIGRIFDEKTIAPNDKDYATVPQAIANLETFIDVANHGNLFGSVIIKREGVDEPVVLSPIYSLLKRYLEEDRADGIHTEETRMLEEAVDATENWAKAELEKLKPGCEFIKIDPRRSGDIYIVAKKDGEEIHIPSINLRRERGHPVGRPWEQEAIPAPEENPDEDQETEETAELEAENEQEDEDLEAQKLTEIKEQIAALQAQQNTLSAYIKTKKAWLEYWAKFDQGATEEERKKNKWKKGALITLAGIVYVFSLGVGIGIFASAGAGAGLAFQHNKLKHNKKRITKKLKKLEKEKQELQTANDS